ncbi:hypothetical protein [uncultured Clostridium sp.]|uniref:hypothetical protein n=1 Tax=uncultured Clostridium sp. TaxID=59620 RepID=UPI0026293EB9|nr:hypothetical protein [uncultured Clostridium sp.]
MKKLAITVSTLLCIFIIGIGIFLFKEDSTLNKSKSLLTKSLNSSVSSITPENTSTTTNASTNSTNTTPSNTSSISVANTSSSSTTATSPKSSFISQLESLGTGNFSTLTNLINEENGFIQITTPAGECTTITNLHREGKALVGTGYTVFLLNFPATFYINNLGNNKYEIHEFFDGKYVALYTGTYSSGNEFSCTKTIIGTGGIVSCLFSIVQPNNYAFTSSPYYVGTVGNTNVKMAVNGQSFNVYEQYENDRNSFLLLPTAIVPNALKHYASNNTFIYCETYNTVTGYFFLTSSNNGNTLTGVYIRRLNNGYSNPELVSLNGATLP